MSEVLHEWEREHLLAVLPAHQDAPFMLFDEVQKIIDARLGAIMALLPRPAETNADGMVEHDRWSHSSGLQCDLCPGYPHISCVPASALRAALATHPTGKAETDG